MSLGSIKRRALLVCLEVGVDEFDKSVEILRGDLNKSVCQLQTLATALPSHFADQNSRHSDLVSPRTAPQKPPYPYRRQRPEEHAASIQARAFRPGKAEYVSIDIQ